MSTLSVTGTHSSVDMKSKSFREVVAFHQHNAILRDLNELFSTSSENVYSNDSHSLVWSLPPDKLLMFESGLKICQVQFKHVFRHYKLPESLNDSIRVGEFVVVESLLNKSQEDLGVVTNIYSVEEFLLKTALDGPSQDTEENTVGQIFRIACQEERYLLPVKYHREMPILQFCKTFIHVCQLPMTVYGVQYQFDGNVLYVYYVSQYRVDFRPLVKYLTKFCKGTRIQMKKTNQCRMFVPNPAAAEALVTGDHCTI